MDPQRKKIYIIVSAACLALAVGILVWSQLSTTTVENPEDSSITATRPSCSNASGDYTSGFRAPSVFPACDKYNTEVLNTATFKSLQTYTPINVGQELGRPDPFKNY